MNTEIWSHDNLGPLVGAWLIEEVWGTNIQAVDGGWFTITLELS